MNRKYRVQIAGFTVSLALALTVALLVFAASALAAPPNVNWGTQVNAGECATTGSPVVNVTHKVVNSVDSGVGGNNWAFEDYNKRIQVWDQGGGAYCAVVSYLGHFTGVAGQQSPGNTAPLDGDEDGTFQGGYRAVITGDLLVEPTWPTRGRIGVIDYGCDIGGNCPGAVSWVDQYFQASSKFKYAWWGWIYHGGRHGTWVNSSDGNAGDIS
jgi:hypothetical protein